MTLICDAENIAEKIRLHIEDENFRKVMGEKGFVSVQKKFSPEKQIIEYINWYDKILNG